MTSAEFATWQEYATDYGLPDSRQEAATAIGSAAICQTFGGRVKPDELLPRFGRERMPTPDEVAAQFQAIAESINAQRAATR
jgi:hypothetical protein